MGAGILLAAYRRGEQRAYWVGFVIFGGFYLGVIVLTALLSKHDLLTSQLSQLAYSLVIPDSQQAQYVQTPTTTAYPAYAMATTLYSAPGNPAPQPAPSLPPPIMPPPATAAIAAWNPNPNHTSMEKFVSIGHSLWLLLVAVIGGKLGQRVFRTSTRDE